MSLKYPDPSPIDDHPKILKEIVETIRRSDSGRELNFPELDIELFDFSRSAEAADEQFLGAALKSKRLEEEFVPHLITASMRNIGNTRCLDFFYNLASRTSSLVLCHNPHVLEDPAIPEKVAFVCAKLERGSALHKITHFGNFGLVSSSVCLHPHEFFRQVDRFLNTNQPQDRNLISIFSAIRSAEVDELTVGVVPKKREMIRSSADRVEISLDYDFTKITVAFTLAPNWELTSSAWAA